MNVNDTVFLSNFSKENLRFTTPNIAMKQKAVVSHAAVPHHLDIDEKMVKF